MKQYVVNGIGIWAEHDRFIREVLMQEEYKYLYDYETVVDLGANVGTFSFWIYPHAKRIWSIEPNKLPYDLLCKTVKDNGLDKIMTVNSAITATGGERQLANGDDFHHDYGGGLVADTGVVINSYSMTQFMEQNKIEYIDLLKIDVEGCEKEIFESESFKKASGHIGTIIGEYHRGDINEYIKRLLTGLGYKYEDKTGANSSGHFIARKK